jgi:hypothetical protein
MRVAGRQVHSSEVEEGPAKAKRGPRRVLAGSEWCVILCAAMRDSNLKQSSDAKSKDGTLGPWPLGGAGTGRRSAATTGRKVGGHGD